MTISRHPAMGFLALTAISIAPLYSCQKASDKDSRETVNPSSTVSPQSGSSGIPKDDFLVAGKLVLGTLGGSVATSKGLQDGQTIEGGKVFVKGFETQVATSDAAGEFILQVKTGSLSTGALTGSGSYKIVMWYTIPGQSGSTSTARFGTNAAINPTLGDSTGIDLGNVSLTYTMALHMTITNALSATLTGCKITLGGIGVRLLSIDNGGGKYDIDYLPPDTYDITASCSGYKDKTVSFVVTAATALGAWQTVPTFALDPQ